MLLADLVKTYATNRDIAPDSLKNLRGAVASYSAHLGRPAALSDFAREPVNKWLQGEVERVARRTAKNYRAAILTLWRFAFEDEELIDNAPRKIRRVRAPLPPVEAYTPNEVERLLWACDSLTNQFCKLAVARKLLYRALILVAWHTGFRPGDLMRLRWQSVAENGAVTITQHKTGNPITKWVDTETLGALEAIRLDGVETIFGKHTCLETWRSVHRSLRKISGVKRGTPKWIRRAHGTRVAVIHGEEAAGRALGHLSSGVARQSYIDQSQMPTAAMRVPRLKRRRQA